MKLLLSYIVIAWSGIIDLVKRIKNWWKSYRTDVTSRDGYSGREGTVVDPPHKKKSITGYKKTPSDKYKSWLSQIPPIPHQAPLTKWPRLSQQLLQELFAELGVEYVPGIVLHESKHQDPVSAFIDFCKRFDCPDKPATRQYLQDVVLFLVEMDDLRQRHPLNPEPIYQELEQHQWSKAENLLEGMKQAINLLEKLDSREVRLGQHRKLLNDIKDILSLEWFDYLDKIDELYSVHLEWQESEKQYCLFQEQIVIRIKTIDKHGRIALKKVDDAYQNIKRIWSRCIRFLEEEGNPDDPELGFPKLELIRKALDKILNFCGESVSEPVDESGMSLDKARKILGLKSKTLDLDIVKKAYRRMAMKYHPDRHPESDKKDYYDKKFKQIKLAYERLQEECWHHG